jgi:hypothetical protein
VKDTTHTFNAYDAGIRPEHSPLENSQRLKELQDKVLSTTSEAERDIYFPASKEPYTFAYALRTASDLTFYGDGRHETHLRCVGKTNKPFPAASVFLLGGFSQRELPRLWNKGEFKPVADISDVPTQQVTLQRPEDAASFQVGDMVVISSSEWTQNTPMSEEPVGFYFQVTNEVAAVEDEVIKLKYSIDHAALGQQNKPIVMANLTRTTVVKGTWPDKTPFKAFGSKNVTVRDMKLSSEHVEGFGIAFDNILNCHYRNLEIDARSIVYGNGANYCSFQNITGTFHDFFSDCKAGFYKSLYENIEVTFVNRDFPLNNLFAIGEAARAVTVKNVRLHAHGHTGGMLVQGEDHVFNGLEVESDMTKIFLHMPLTQEGYPTKNVRFQNCKFVIPKPTQFVQLQNSGQGTLAPEGIAFEDCHFEGEASNGKAVRVLSPAKNVRFSNNTFTGGGYEVAASAKNVRLENNRFAKGAIASNKSS